MIGRLHTGLRVRRPRAVETRVNRAEGQQRRGLAPDLGRRNLSLRMARPGIVPGKKGCKSMQDEDKGVGMGWVNDRRVLLGHLTVLYVL